MGNYKMCKDRHATIGWIYLGLAITCAVYGFFAIIKIPSFSMIGVLFPVYYMLFGLIMTMGFCKFGFITEQYLFLRSTTGRGFFNLFISGMFIVYASTPGTLGL